VRQRPEQGLAVQSSGAGWDDVKVQLQRRRYSHYAYLYNRFSAKGVHHQHNQRHG
jgi:hypothetical protein